jgi:hypothetical protein
MPQPKQPSLFEFLAVYSLSTSHANIDIRNSHSVKMEENVQRTMMIPVENSKTVMKRVRPMTFATGRRKDIMIKDDPKIRAARWYGILCTVLCSLKNQLGAVGDKGEALVLEILSTTWHVHEWVATNFQDTKTHPQVEEVVEKLFKTLQKWELPALDDLVKRTLLVASYFRWEI